MDVPQNQHSKSLGSIRDAVVRFVADHPLLMRRFGAIVVEVGLIVTFSAIWRRFVERVADRANGWPPAWSFHLAEGLAIFTILWIGFGLLTGTSPGKMLMDVEVVREEQRMRKFWRILLRWAVSWPAATLCILLALDLLQCVVLSLPIVRLGKSLLFLLVIASIWLLPLVATKGKRGLNDFVCGTTARQRKPGGLAMGLRIAAVCVVFLAVVLQSANIYRGLGRLRISPDGRCVVWFPADPLDVDRFRQVTEVEFRDQVRYGLIDINSDSWEMVAKKAEDIANSHARQTFSAEVSTSILWDPQNSAHFNLFYYDLKPGESFDWASYAELMRGGGGSVEFRGHLKRDGYPGWRFSILFPQNRYYKSIDYLAILADNRVYVLSHYSEDSGVGNGSLFEGSFGIRY